MVIKESDFILTQLDDSILWTLELLYTIKPKNKEPYEDFKVRGYGYSLQTAIQKIVLHRVKRKNIEAAKKAKQSWIEYLTLTKKLNDYLPW